MGLDHICVLHFFQWLIKLLGAKCFFVSVLLFYCPARCGPPQDQSSRACVKTSPGHRDMAISVRPMVGRTYLSTSQSKWFCLRGNICWPCSVWKHWFSLQHILSTDMRRHHQSYLRTVMGHIVFCYKCHGLPHCLHWFCGPKEKHKCFLFLYLIALKGSMCRWREMRSPTRCVPSHPKTSRFRPWRWSSRTRIQEQSMKPGQARLSVPRLFPWSSKHSGQGGRVVVGQGWVAAKGWRMKVRWSYDERYKEDMLKVDGWAFWWKIVSWLKFLQEGLGNVFKGKTQVMLDTLG